MSQLATSAVITHPTAGDGYELTERCDLGCIQIIAGGEDQAAVDSLAKFMEIVPPVVGAVSRDAAGNCLIGLSPRFWLLVCPSESEDDIVQKYAGAFPDGTILASAFGDHLPWLELSGARATVMLCQMGFLGLKGKEIPANSARRHTLGHVPVILQRLGRDHWRIGVERSRVGHFCNWLESASANQGGWPIA